MSISKHLKIEKIKPNSKKYTFQSFLNLKMGCLRPALKRTSDTATPSQTGKAGSKQSFSLPGEKSGVRPES